MASLNGNISKLFLFSLFILNCSSALIISFINSALWYLLMYLIPYYVIRANDDYSNHVLIYANVFEFPRYNYVLHISHFIFFTLIFFGLANISSSN
jgi:hypothetical protein